MPPNKKAATYKRAPETRGQSIPYNQKFANLIKLCAKAQEEKCDNIIVAFPWVLGDTYEEIVESLSRIAASRLILHIVEPGDDEHLSVPGIETN
jgi:hypothetical protein